MKTRRSVAAAGLAALLALGAAACEVDNGAIDDPGAEDPAGEDDL